MKSAVFTSKGNKIGERSFVLEKYNIGLSRLKTDELSNKIVVGPMTPNDTMTIKSFVTLPEPFIRYSKINLPGTSILDRANLNLIGSPNLWQVLNDKTNIQEILINDLDSILEFKNDKFADNIKNYVLGTEKKREREKEQGGGTKEQIYQRFADHITPTTRSIIHMMKQYINDKLSIVDIVSYLEPFLIYTDDITYQQYKEIIAFLNYKISEFNKRFGERSVIFRSLRSKNQRPENILLKDIISRDISDDIFKLYRVSDSDTKSEFLNRLIRTDSAKLYSIALSLQNKSLMIQKDLQDLFQDELVDLTEKKKTDSECANVIVAKFYNSVDELEMDNEKTVYFDKRYDKTNYSMIDEYENDITRMTRDDFYKHFCTQLEKKYKLTKDDAKYLADTLIEGHKRIRDGQYAILFNYDNDVSIVYYIRKNNKWIKTDITVDGAINASEVESDLLCNLQATCVSVPGKIEDTCDNVSNEQINKKNKFIKDMLSEFDAKYTRTKKESDEYIKRQYEYLSLRVEALNNIHRSNMLKYNKQKYLLSTKIDETLQTKPMSPFVKIRDMILSQTDFTKKQVDIVRFCAAYTRPANPPEQIGPLGEMETFHWLYCIRTNTKIIPTFKLDLAHTFVNNKDNYNNIVEGLKKTIGKMSDDGNQWVDKNSGWPITNIEFDTDEGYDDAGFKVVTRDVLENDITFDNPAANAVNNVPDYTRPESKMILNIVIAITQNMGVNLDSQIDFIVNNVTNVLSNTIEGESTYKTKIKQAADKGKSIPSYKAFYNWHVLYFTLGMIIIAIQTSIPSIRTRKTYPGCVKSFSGFPFEDNEDYSSLEYLACVVVDTRKSHSEPWDVIKKRKDDTEDSFKSGIVQSIKVVIDKYLIRLQDVVRKKDEKTQYLLIHPTQEIPDEYNIQGWKGFLPPLVRFKIKQLENITKDFKQKMRTELKSGDMGQREKILVIQSKIIGFSFALQEKIESILSKKAILLKRSNNQPYLENACCDDGKIGESVIDYFNKDDSSIRLYNKSVSGLVDLLADINWYSTATMFSINGVVKSKSIAANSDFSERTIYLGFIHFCNFKTPKPISQDLITVCKEKPPDGTINYASNSEEVMNNLKDAGKIYKNEDFLRLLQLVARKHQLAVGTDKPVESSIERFKKVIDAFDNDNDNDNNADAEEEESDTIKLLKPLIEIFDDALDTFDVAEEDASDETERLRNYLGKNIEKMKTKISNFIQGNPVPGINRNNKLLRNVDTFMNDLENWSSEKSTRNQDNKISNDSLYTYVNFFQNFVRSFVDVFPNIILNKIEHTNTSIPKYWDLSPSHTKDIQNMIRDYYKDLVKFYDATIIRNILVNIQMKSTRLIQMVNAMPGFSSIRKGDGTLLTHVFGEITSKYFFQYCLLKVFTNYIDLCDDQNMMIFESSLNVNGNENDLQQNVSHLLIVFMNIMQSHKDKINISYEDILERIFKEKEDEKYSILDRLDKMNNAQREVNNVLKKHKLGEWGVGLKKSLVTYDPLEYEKEANKERSANATATANAADEDADAERVAGAEADMESNEMHDGNTDDDQDDDYGNDNDDQD